MVSITIDLEQELQRIFSTTLTQVSLLRYANQNWTDAKWKTLSDSFVVEYNRVIAALNQEYSQPRRKTEDPTHQPDY